MATHSEFKMAGPNNVGETTGTIQIEVDIAKATSTVAATDIIELCAVQPGTIITSVDEVVLTIPTLAAETSIGYATLGGGSGNFFKTNAAIGSIDTAAIGEMAAANAKYFPAADTLKVTFAAQVPTPARLVYLVHYRVVQLKAKP